MKHKVIIIGSGPAGLTSAIYAGRAGLKPLVFAGIKFGGQLMDTTKIENYPGFPEGIDGPELMQNMITQAQKFGAVITYENVTHVNFSQEIKKVYVETEEYQADTVIIATGATPKRLGIPGEEEYYGRGVSTCATCDGAFYKEKTVAVVGGGDVAMEEATFLTRFAKRVYLVHRRDEFRASKIMQQRALTNNKIEIIFDTEVKAVLGEQTVNALEILNNKTNEKSQLKVDGMFLAIGHIPVTGYIGDELEKTEAGYIKAKDEIYTSVNGVFVAGDVQDQVYRQAITSAGAGCKAAMAAEKWIAEKE